MHMASSTAAVAAVSDRLSAAVASMAAEWILLPTRRLYRHIYSFTQMDAARITRAATLKSTADGWRIFSTDVLASSTPIRRMRPATMRPETYSSRPWPKG